MDLVQQYSSSLHTLPDSITPWLRAGMRGRNEACTLRRGGGCWR